MCRFQGGFGILESFCKDDKLKLVVAWKFFVEERCSFGNDIFLKISHFFQLSLVKTIQGNKVRISCFATLY